MIVSYSEAAWERRSAGRPPRWRSCSDCVYLVAEPRPGDLAAHVFRAELFGREGFTLWNGHWYGGHHTPAYSVLSPPLSWLLGPRLLLVASCVACAVLFERLAREHFGPERAWAGALWLGVGTVTLLATSRLPFALGTAFGLGALLALARDRPRAAAALALLSPLASPVAGRSQRWREPPGPCPAGGRPASAWPWPPRCPWRCSR